MAANAANPPDAATELLERADWKQAMASADKLQDRYRRGYLALLSLGGYVVLATLGFGKEERALEADERRAKATLARTDKLAGETEGAENEAFVAHLTAERQLKQAQAVVPVAAAAAARAHEESQAEQDKRAKSEEQATAADKQEQDRLKGELADAEQRLAAADHAVEAFKDADVDKRFTWDVRREEMPADLARAVTAAQDQVAAARAALDKAKKKRRAAAPAPAPSGAPARGPAAPPALEVAAKAATDEADTARDLALAHRKAERAAADRAEAARAAEKNDERRAHRSITLPVIGIALDPSTFFNTAPVLLLALFVEVMLAGRALRRTVDWLRAEAKADGKTGPDFLAIVPGLDGGVGARAPSAFAAGGVLVSLLVLCGNGDNGIAIASVVAVVLYGVVTGATRVLSAARRHTPKTESAADDVGPRPAAGL